MNTPLPSNKKFGLLFTVVFLALALYAYFRHGFSITVLFLLLVGLFFLIAGWFDSTLLTPFNKAWFLLGLVLGKVVSPIVLGIIFFVLITPVALILKIIGRDELKLHKSTSKTYWVEPIGSNSDSESFKNQF